MKIDEAILYVLAERNGGLRTEQIAEIINRKKLHVRKDGQPVTSTQVYAVAMRFPDTFVKAEGRIMLMIWEADEAADSQYHHADQGADVGSPAIHSAAVAPIGEH